MWSARQPLTIVDISRRVGLHPNTVRFHLGVLADHGLITQRTEERNQRGRPRIYYSIVPSQLYAHRRNYQLLAQVLVTYLTQLHPRQTDLAAVGDAWGKYLAKHTDLSSQLSAMRAVLSCLDHAGFATTLEGQKMLFHHCPFREAADQNQSVVCPVHFGLLRGLFTALRVPLSVTRLIPSDETSACVALLTARGQARDSGQASG